MKTGCGLQLPRIHSSSALCISWREGYIWSGDRLLHIMQTFGTPCASKILLDQRRTFQTCHSHDSRPTSCSRPARLPGSELLRGRAAICKASQQAEASLSKAQKLKDDIANASGRLNGLDRQARAL